MLFKPLKAVLAECSKYDMNLEGELTAVALEHIDDMVRFHAIDLIASGKTTISIELKEKHEYAKREFIRWLTDSGCRQVFLDQTAAGEGEEAYLIFLPDGMFGR